jgi:hypothetical protein
MNRGRDEFPWMNDVEHALRQIRRSLRKGMHRCDPERLQSQVRLFLRTHDKARTMCDLWWTHAAEHGDPVTAHRGRTESEQLQRKHDYRVRGWLELLADVLQRTAAEDRRTLEGFAADWERLRSAAREGLIRPKPAVAKVLLESTPAQVREFEDWLRKDVAVVEELIRELRSAAQRMTDAAVDAAATRRRKPRAD